jgi:hypothetical protein
MFFPRSELNQALRRLQAAFHSTDFAAPVATSMLPSEYFRNS